MTELAPVLTNCVLCRHPLVVTINKRIRDNGIAGAMRWCAENEIFGDKRLPHRNTFSAHKNEHLTDEWEKKRQAAVEALEKQKQTIKGKPGDLAALVRDNVFARVEEGLLEPSLTEGLRAQEMLDRRAEKGADRDMMIALAGLLSGASTPVALLGDGAIEGTFRDVTDERREDEAVFAGLLAPPG